VVNFAQTRGATERTLVVLEPSSQGSGDGVTIKVSLGSSIADERPQAMDETDALRTCRSEKAAGA
jgi:hypothetical protein